MSVRSTSSISNPSPYKQLSISPLQEIGSLSSLLPNDDQLQLTSPNPNDTVESSPAFIDHYSRIDGPTPSGVSDTIRSDRVFPFQFLDLSRSGRNSPAAHGQLNATAESYHSSPDPRSGRQSTLSVDDGTFGDLNPEELKEHLKVFSGAGRHSAARLASRSPQGNDLDTLQGTFQNLDLNSGEHQSGDAAGQSFGDITGNQFRPGDVNIPSNPSHTIVDADYPTYRDTPIRGAAAGLPVMGSFTQTIPGPRQSQVNDDQYSSPSYPVTGGGNCSMPRPIYGAQPIRPSVFSAGYGLPPPPLQPSMCASHAPYSHAQPSAFNSRYDAGYPITHQVWHPTVQGRYQQPYSFCTASSINGHAPFHQFGAPQARSGVTSREAGFNITFSNRISCTEDPNGRTERTAYPEIKFTANGDGDGPVNPQSVHFVVSSLTDAMKKMTEINQDGLACDVGDGVSTISRSIIND